MDLIPDKWLDEYNESIKDLDDINDVNEKLSKYIPKGYGNETFEKLINDEIEEMLFHK